MQPTLKDCVRELKQTETEFGVVSILGHIYSHYLETIKLGAPLGEVTLTEDEYNFLNNLKLVDLDFKICEGYQVAEVKPLETMMKLIIKTDELDTASIKGLYHAFCNTSFPFEHFVRYDCSNLSAYQLKLLILIYIHCFSNH